MQLSASLIYFVFIVQNGLGVKLLDDAAFRSDVKTRMSLAELKSTERQCGVCQLGGHSAGKLFLKGRVDGTGSRAKALVDGMAFAAKVGMNFGGALVEKGVPDHQRGNTTNVKRMLDTLVGSSRWSVLEVPKSKEWDVCGQGNVYLQSFVNGFIQEKHGDQNVFLRGADECFLWGAEVYKSYSGGSSLYTPQFLQTFRTATALPTYKDLFGDTRRPVVAVHLRREDVSFDDVDRVTPDIVYYNLISKIRKHLPDAEVHVFAGQKCVFCNGNRWEPVDFEGYRAQGMTLHLDEDPLVAWAHFARADVMAMSKSSFSFVPALLNPNCVIYQPYWHQPLDEWMVISGESEQAEIKDDDLRKCLNRIQGPKRSQRI
eukprot:TRINITY_DN17809_c0_g1_i1.p1 TRINITY_DN17809_c0_g1~~TRINITY_DN17809_c0_g1_i1.p1  ORF type:complete len:372 (+),score=61.59 TRINITY_DN17809_c0_g1_i1:147-1262(+)